MLLSLYHKADHGTFDCSIFLCNFNLANVCDDFAYLVRSDGELLYDVEVTANVLRKTAHDWVRGGSKKSVPKANVHVHLVTRPEDISVGVDSLNVEIDMARVEKSWKRQSK